MKSIKAAIIGVICIALSACGGTPNPNPPSPVTSPISATTLTLIQTGATVATGAVLNFAVTQPTTRTKLANEIYASASGIYTLTGGTLPTPAQLNTTLAAWSISGSAQYTQYTTALDALYSTYYTKYLAGNLTAQDISSVLNAIAAGAEAATQSYVSTPTS